MQSLEIMALGRDSENVGTKDIYMAVLCQPHLINKESDLLRLFNYKKQYVVRHFSERNEADSWLSSFRNA